MESVVKTRDGEIRGSLINGVHTFKGIPYAAPPFGANRLLPPQPVTPWRGVRDALKYGPKALQVPYPPGFEVINSLTNGIRAINPRAASVGTSVARSLAA